MKPHPHGHPKPKWLLGLYKLNDRYQLHPIAVHIPNGMVPVAAFFMVAGCLLDIQGLVFTAYVNLAVIFLSMPGVIVTGIASWQHRYKGAATPLFRTKLICSVLVLAGAGLILLFQTLYPVNVHRLTASGKTLAAAYLLLLAPTMRAGALGGKLVFGSRKKA